MLTQLFAQFHFLRPEWFLAIPVVAILLALFYHHSRQSNGWEKVCDPALLDFQLTRSTEPRNSGHRLLVWLIPLIFLLTIIALAGPSWEKKEQPVFQKKSALVIVLDLSISMNAEDIKPSRLERAKLKIIDILKQKKEGQTALVAYAGDAHTVSPLTIDNKTIISLLPALDSSIMPLSGSHVVAAMQTAKELLINAGYTQGDILLFTDGIEASEQNKMQQLVKQFNRQGYHTSIIGVGSRSGSPIPIPGQGGFIKDRSGQVVLSKLDEQPLKSISQAGGGFYHSLSLDDSDFKEILTSKFADKNQLRQQDDQLEQWLDAGVYLTLLIIPLALLIFRRGLLSVVLAFFLLPVFYPEQAQAQTEQNNTPPVQVPESFNWKKSWKDLWLTPDQQAEQAFKQQHYQQAAETFEDPLWKAGASYRAGDYNTAVQKYSQYDSANALYNKGNALANLQKFSEAISAYEEALKKNPQLSDAKKNLDYLKKLLEKQQQKSGQNSNSQKNNNQKDQSKNKDSQQQQDSKSGDDNKEQDQQQQDSQNNQGKSQSDSQSEEKQSEQKQPEQKKSEQNKDSEQQNKEQNGKQSEKNQQQSKNSQTGQNKRDKKPEGPQQARHPKNPDANEQEKNKSAQNMQPEQQSEKDEDKQKNEKKAQPGHQPKNVPNDVMSQLSQEEQQSLKQWLQRIPDNPGELLRIKFRNNTLIKQRQENRPEQYEGNPW